MGEYVLDAQVGKGAFGEVWRAKHHVWADRVVAVKVPTDDEEGFFSADVAKPGDAERRGQQEGQRTIDGDQTSAHG